MLTSGQFHGRSDCWQQILAARMIQRIFRGARVRSITRKSRTLAKTARRIQLTLRFTQLRDILHREMEAEDEFAKECLPDEVFLSLKLPPLDARTPGETHSLTDFKKEGWKHRDPEPNPTSWTLKEQWVEV